MITNSDTRKHLVSCIMPTYNRRHFIPQSIKYFLRQDYENSELIIVDDGTFPVKDIIPNDDRIRYIRMEKRVTVGTKRNIACEEAKGDIIVHWDDDDWHAPHRLKYQVNAIIKAGAEVCGISKLIFYDVRKCKGWQYVYPSGQRFWLSGSSLCYTKDFWSHNKFEDINIGEDSRFVWRGCVERMIQLDDSTFHIGIIHDNNVSPKRTNGNYWQHYPDENIQKIFALDWIYYEKLLSNEKQKVAPLKNVFACLVHESIECVVDLVRNLKYHDPTSVILLYNGSNDPNLLKYFPFNRYDVVIHPSPLPMRWGWLHDFALDCMKFALDNLSFDTITIVDSDQLGIHRGYSDYLSHFLSGKSNVGMLCNSPLTQTSSTKVAPAIQAWKEFELWLPMLRQFKDGEEKFVQWSFWPTTVFTKDAIRDLLKFFDTNNYLREIMSRTKIWASEEVILPTLVALLGYGIIKNPCNHDYVAYRKQYSVQQMDLAASKTDIFWVHPVSRRYEDTLRKHIRAKYNHYERDYNRESIQSSNKEFNASHELFLTIPIIMKMKKIEGWLEDDEADLLIAATALSLRKLPATNAIVEVGSYCGRTTFVIGSVVKAISPDTKVYAVDPHDGSIGSLDHLVQNVTPTLERFNRTITDSNLIEIVHLIQKKSYEVVWDKPINFLFIDGLHDYMNVARDFLHFEAKIVQNGYIAFHDYADYYPGVKTFVNELLSSGKYKKVYSVNSMILIEKI